MAGKHRRRRRRKHCGRPEWSKLPGDLLELILEELDLAGHARFASVCSSWRSVANNNPAVNKPLYFALSRNPVRLACRFIASFIPSWKKARFIGAGLDGWLVILIDGRDLFLLNKALNSVIPLPPPPPLPCDKKLFFDISDMYKAVLSSPPLSSPPSSASVEYTVVLKHSYVGVFYCRLRSDKSFTRLSNIQWAEDILFYKGRLYVLCFPNTIIIFDHLLNKVSELPTHRAEGPNPRRWLISGNNMMSIVTQRPSRYCLLTYDEPGRYFEVTLDGRIGDSLLLIVNYYCSLCITSTKERKEFRPATNYFKDDISTLIRDVSEDPNKAKANDPWPLFSIMFSYRKIENLAKYKP